MKHIAPTKASTNWRSPVKLVACQVRIFQIESQQGHELTGLRSPIVREPKQKPAEKNFGSKAAFRAQFSINGSTRARWAYGRAFVKVNDHDPAKRKNRAS